MKRKSLLIFLVLLHPLPTLNNIKKLIVWNVGQGQWVTFINEGYCLHFDVGGEFFPKNILLQKYCRYRKNVFYLTHLDWDHISFLKKSSQILPMSCITEAHTSKSFKKNRLLRSVFVCHQKHQRWVSKIYSGHQGSKSNPNRSSQVYVVDNVILISGDSISMDEHIWSKSPLLQKVKYFVVGHHGSATSSSAQLLKSLKTLKLAIVSARKNKYGHPHHEVLTRYSQKKVPVITTETFGHIIIDL
ncbi:MAG: hypothetical protein R2827_05715 [Bdellovibrionales bacterium]